MSRHRRLGSVVALIVSASVLGAAHVAWAQAPPADGGTRAGRISARQKEKAKHLKPYAPNKAEVWVKKLEEQFLTGRAPTIAGRGAAGAAARA